MNYKDFLEYAELFNKACEETNALKVEVDDSYILINKDTHEAGEIELEQEEQNPEFENYEQ